MQKLAVGLQISGILVDRFQCPLCAKILPPPSAGFHIILEPDVPRQPQI
jgi:hypothetical protein